MIAIIKNWIDAIVWSDVLMRYGIPGRIVLGVLRNAYAVLRDIFSGQLTTTSWHHEISGLGWARAGGEGGRNATSMADTANNLPTHHKACTRKVPMRMLPAVTPRPHRFFRKPNRMAFHLMSFRLEKWRSDLSPIAQ